MQKILNMMTSAPAETIESTVIKAASDFLINIPDTPLSRKFLPDILSAEKNINNGIVVRHWGMTDAADSLIPKRKRV